MNRRQSILKTLAGITAATALTPKASAAEPNAENPELEAIRALIKAHDDALSQHDMNGVLATMSPDAVVMGCGPGELWSGHAEIKDAYLHFFEGFDKGEQEYHYNYRFGGLSSDMGWLTTSGEIKGKKNGEPVSFPINISLTAVKSGGAWRIASLHYSTLTGEGPSQAKAQ